MSVQTLVLYGNRLDGVTTYSNNQDPQTFAVNLSDSTSLADDRVVDNIVKAVSDAIAAADARIVATGTKSLTESTTLTETIAKILTHTFPTEAITMGDSRTIQAIKVLPELTAPFQAFPRFGQTLYNGSLYGFNAASSYNEKVFVVDSIVHFLATKALTESLTMTEHRIFSASMVLLDTLLVADAAIHFDFTKGFSEFIRIKDWVELRWTRVNIWTPTAAFNRRAAKLHLYGPGVYYAVDYYSNNLLVNWLISEAGTATWETQPSNDNALPLYSDPLYSKNTYSHTPEVGWTKPDSDAKQAWTNNNGESHN